MKSLLVITRDVDMNCLEWVDLNMFESHVNDETMNSTMDVEDDAVDNDNSDDDDALNWHLNDNIDKNSTTNLKVMTKREKKQTPSKEIQSKERERENESNQSMRRYLTRSSGSSIS